MDLPAASSSHIWRGAQPVSSSAEPLSSQACKNRQLRKGCWPSGKWASHAASLTSLMRVKIRADILNLFRQSRQFLRRHRAAGLAQKQQSARDALRRQKPPP